MLRFMCPSCKHVLSARKELAGRTTKCPKCDQELMIPDPESQGVHDKPQASVWKKAAFLTLMGILSVGCLSLLLYSVYQMGLLADETIALEKAKALIAEQRTFNDDLVERATLAQADAKRKLKLASDKHDAAEDAPRRAGLLAEKAEADRKQAKEDRSKAQALLETVGQRQREILQNQRDANRAKAEAVVAKADAEKQLLVAKQAEQNAASLKEQAQLKEEKSRQAAKDATKKLQLAEETLQRIEANRGLKALLSKMTSKNTPERKEATLLLKSLGPGLYPKSVASTVCLAVSVEKDTPLAKAMLDALAVIDSDLAPPVVSLMLNVQPNKEGNGADFASWLDSLKRINNLKASASAPVLRFRLQTLKKYLGQDDVALVALEIIKTLAELAPDEASVKAIGDILAKSLTNAALQDGALASLVAIYPQAKGSVCVAFGRLAKNKDAEFLIKLAKSATGLRDKRLTSELSPLRFHPSVEVRAAAEEVFRLER
jgi:hypothetical protein